MNKTKIVLPALGLLFAFGSLSRPCKAQEVSRDSAPEAKVPFFYFPEPHLRTLEEARAMSRLQEARNNKSEDERQKRWKLMTEGSMASKNELQVTLRDHQVFRGVVTQVQSDAFMLRDRQDGREISVGISEIRKIRPVPHPRKDSRQGFEKAGLIALGVLALPLTILMALTGWDGC